MREARELKLALERILRLLDDGKLAAARHALANLIQELEAEAQRRQHP